MKKLWIVALALLLLSALSLPALAEENAQPTITYVDSVQYEIRDDYSETEDGYHVEIRPTDPENVDEEELLEAAQESEKIQEAGEIGGYEIVDIVKVSDSDGEVVDLDEPVRVAMTYDKLSRLVTVFVQNEDGTWSEADFIVGPDYIQIELLDTMVPTVAFAFAEMRPAPTDDSPVDPSTYSPQTGDNSLIWTALAMSFALGAALSLRAAKKAGE